MQCSKYVHWIYIAFCNLYLSLSKKLYCQNTFMSRINCQFLIMFPSKCSFSNQQYSQVENWKCDLLWKDDKITRIIVKSNKKNKKNCQKKSISFTVHHLWSSPLQIHVESCKEICENLRILLHSVLSVTM